MPEHTMYQLERTLEGLEEMVGAAAVMHSITSIATLVFYVLSALALYTMASRRRIAHAWLAWIPIGNLWILGSLSDQYRYIARGETKNKRKSLLTMTIVIMALGILIGILAVAAVICGVQAYSSYDAEGLYAAVGVLVLLILLLGLTIGGLGIAVAIVRFMALYDTYMSASPEHGVLFLVLSIFVTVTEPFFLFFNRNSDQGMVKVQPRQSWPGYPEDTVPPQYQGGQSSQNSGAQNVQCFRSFGPQNSRKEPDAGSQSSLNPEARDPWDRNQE